MRSIFWVAFLVGSGCLGDSDDNLGDWEGPDPIDVGEDDEIDILDAVDPFLAEDADSDPLGFDLSNANPCPEADPTDDLPDADALQRCLNDGGIIALRRGSPGYLINDGLVIKQDGTVLTSIEPPKLAKLKAMPGLWGAMLKAPDRNDVTIAYVELDGNRPNRRQLDECYGYRGGGSNFISGGARLLFSHNRSRRALCGSAFQISGHDYVVGHNLFDYNGRGTEQPVPAGLEPWADGITAGRCIGGRIHHNHVLDATDIGIVNGGGRGCIIENNLVEQSGRHAFAGIGVHNFPGADGDHRDSIVRQNRVHGHGLMSFGLSVGMHPWFTDRGAHGGRVKENAVSGAVVNLAVDGASDMQVRENDLGTPSGSPRCGGSPVRYSAAHAPGTGLQPGYVRRVYDHCIP